MCSFIAAGTAYANHGINTIPFFIYYSMFGFQRIGDSDLGCGRHALPRIPHRRHRRTHHSCRRRPAAPGWSQPRTRAARAESAALTIPRLLTRSAIIIQDGIKRMYIDQESIFYYLTVTNEPLPMPAMPRRQQFAMAC